MIYMYMMLIVRKFYPFLFALSSYCSYIAESSGTWGSWGSWGSCSATCGGGTKTRTRTCHGSCSGSGTTKSSCNTNACPRNGGWGGWSSWSGCSKTCGGGSKSRSRSCNNSSPISPGKTCAGSRSTSTSCNTQQCPRNGGWSNWSNWSACSTTCGGGHKTKSRTCNNPAPNASGKNCSGSMMNRMTCNNNTCPTPPRITLEIPSFVGERDENVTLRCVAEGYPEQYQYTHWNHSVGNKLIQNNLCYENSNIVCSEGELTFKTVTFQDSGFYSCGASNGVKNKYGSLMQKGLSYLHVQSAPIILHFEDAIKIKEDEPISVNFEILSEPQLQNAIFKSALFDTEIRNTSNVSVFLDKKDLMLPIYGVNTTLAGYVASIYIKHGSGDYMGNYKLVLKNNHSQVVYDFKLYMEEPTDSTAALKASDSTLIAGIILITLSIIIALVTLSLFLWRRWKHRRGNKNENGERQLIVTRQSPMMLLHLQKRVVAKNKRASQYLNIQMNKKKTSICYANITTGEGNQPSDTAVYMNATFENTGTDANSFKNRSAFANADNATIQRNYEESKAVENTIYGNV